MFSPASKRPNLGAHKGRSSIHGAPGSPATPQSNAHRPALGGLVPNRPDYGTPMPKSSRFSGVSRIPLTKKIEKGADDQIQPVQIGEFPQVLRSAQASLLRKGVTDGCMISGGMDRNTCLSWMICGHQLFIWSYMSSVATQKCIVLDLPDVLLESSGYSTRSRHNNLLLCVVKWDEENRSSEVLEGQCSVGVILVSRKTHALAYWNDIYLEPEKVAVFSHPKNEHKQIHEAKGIMADTSGNLSNLSECNSLIVSSVPDCVRHECLALACHSNGEVWLFRCTSDGVSREKKFAVLDNGSSGGMDSSTQYTRSLCWRCQDVSSKEYSRQFLILTNQKIQCWNINLTGEINASRLWSQEITGTDIEIGSQKDLTAQKQVCLLDMKVDDAGKELTILLATSCNDKVGNSNYIQYSLLKMQYNHTLEMSRENGAPNNPKVLEKKGPIQVILASAQIEEDDFLTAMQLRIGGKPSGSVMILSRDGTATIAHFWREAASLYQFDLPWDAGNVIDGSVLPSMGCSQEGAWVILTEKNGIWAIPEKAILLGGVESSKQQSLPCLTANESSPGEEQRSVPFARDFGPRKASSEAWEIADRERPVLMGKIHQSAHDKEMEALVLHFFHDFLYSGKVEGVFDKLKNSKAFEKDGETNIFVCASKSIVDTLPKHWTTTRGTEVVAMAVVSSQLVEKQQKHQKYLHFLALSKCHEELSFGQRRSLQIILEHGEKLASMICLRDLQNAFSQKNSIDGSGGSETSGALWDLIQLVGEKARRNNVLLMDREAVEIFYSKVSEIEEIFSCIHHYVSYISEKVHPSLSRIHRACEISKACTILVNAAVNYRKIQSTWYPSPEGLCPWNCQPIVQSGLWSIASLILQLLKESQGSDPSIKKELVIHLEELTDVLLEAYAGSLTAKMEREEDYKGLQMEYAVRRDALLGPMYQHVKELAEAGYKDSCEGSEAPEMKDAILKEFSGHLIAIARRHAGYQTLWDISCDLNDTMLLRSLMYESMGLKEGRFSNFVFERLYENRQYSKILRLGEEFQEELVSFLEQHMDLLWLHEIFLNRFSSASDTLHKLALSQDDKFQMMNVESFNNENTRSSLSLVDRRRLLNLSKISAFTGRELDLEKIQRIEADLHILMVQEEVQHLYDCGDRLIPPAELIEICLRSSEPRLVLRTFDVFAWTSFSFRMSNRNLLEECWMCSANLNDWGRIYKQSVSEGWSDDKILETLQETGLFQAATRCYGPGSQFYEGGFREILPLLQEDIDATEKDSCSSVEAILMRHLDFPEAGKLMITAIVRGKFGNGVGVVHSPMIST
ncbi:Nuclear pore complex protein [Nymphaea thermarum]|nr:Nuclear pore complex protein [Nymphaea thermarum]